MVIMSLASLPKQIAISRDGQAYSCSVGRMNLRGAAGDGHVPPTPQGRDCSAVEKRGCSRLGKILDDYSYVERGDTVVLLHGRYGARRASWIAARLAARREPRQASVASLATRWPEDLAVAARAASESGGRLIVIRVDPRPSPAELHGALLHWGGGVPVLIRSARRTGLLFLAGVSLAATGGFPICADF
jgi:hypothetical protein